MEGQPLQPKRFPLQEDAFAKERIHATRDAILEAKQIYPEIISGGLFGSLARGRSNEATSDIDCMIFIDPTKATIFGDLKIDHQTARIKFLLDGNEQILTEAHGGVEWLEAEDGTLSNKIREFHFTYSFSREDAVPYEELIHKKILERNPDLDVDRLFHVASIPLSEDLIGLSLSHLYSAMAHQEKFKKDLAKMPQESEYAADPDIEYTFRLPFQIHQMFFLEMGSGLQPYREQVIETLEDMEDTGEEIWKGIIEKLEKWEQGKSDNPIGSVHYPKTLAAARKTYLDRDRAGKNI